MKNNTKLIMETWRRFLKEGTEGIDENGMVIEVSDEDDPSALPAVADTDLEGDIKTIDSMRKQNNQTFDDEYNPAGDMGDMDNMGEFNPYDSDPIPPEGLYGAAGDDDYEGDSDNSIDHEAIEYYKEHGIEHDEYGNAIDSYEEEDEKEPVTFDGSIDDSSIDGPGY